MFSFTRKVGGAHLSGMRFAPQTARGGRVLDPVTVMRKVRLSPSALVAVLLSGCVPPGNAVSQDAGTRAQPSPGTAASQAIAPAAQIAPPAEAMKVPFEDDFEHASGAPVRAAADADAPQDGASGEGGVVGRAAPSMIEPSPDWIATAPGIWHIEGGRLCGEHARNHGLWLNRVLPVNARIDFDAVSQSPDGDIKAEFWGDGRSSATALSYTNATSYLTIFGGWHNKFHVLARINEHGNDRQEITVDPNSDDPREKAAVAGQSYHFRVERTDGKTIKWWVNGNEMFSWTDPAPLAGAGHDHFGFNDWDVKLCFDNLKVVPLP